MINIDGRSYLDVQEAAERLGVKPETLYAYVSRGLLRSYKQGIRRRRLYLQSEIEALLALRPVDAGDQSATASAQPSAERGRVASLDAGDVGDVGEAPASPQGAAPPAAALPSADDWAAER